MTPQPRLLYPLRGRPGRVRRRQGPRCASAARFDPGCEEISRRKLLRRLWQTPVYSCKDISGRRERVRCGNGTVNSTTASTRRWRRQTTTEFWESYKSDLIATLSLSLSLLHIMPNNNCTYKTPSPGRWATRYKQNPPKASKLSLFLLLIIITQSTHVCAIYATLDKQTGAVDILTSPSQQEKKVPRLKRKTKTPRINSAKRGEARLPARPPRHGP